MLRVFSVLIDCVLSFAILGQALFEELDIGIDVFVVGARCVERVALIVEQYVEGLCIGTKLSALQVAPLVAYGAQHDILAILGEADGLGERSLVVHVERYEYIVPWSTSLYGYTRNTPTDTEVHADHQLRANRST